MTFVILACALSACLASEDSDGDVVTSSPNSKADDDDLPRTLLLRQGHVPTKIGFQCSYRGVSPSHTGCAWTITLTPDDYTKRLMGNRLRGKTIADLPMPVVKENAQGEPFGSIDVIADLRVADGTRPVVGALDDGTPVMFVGDLLTFENTAESLAVVQLQMHAAFWYNSVDFEWSYAWAPIDLP